MAKSKNMSIDLADVDNIYIRQQNNETIRVANDTTTDVLKDETIHVVNDTTTQKRKVRAQRTNGSTYYLEDMLRKKMKMACAIHEIDMQDIVRTSVDYFFRQFGEDNGIGLTETGVRLISEYMEAMNQRALEKL